MCIISSWSPSLAAIPFHSACKTMLFSVADQSVTLPPDLTWQPFKRVTFSGVIGCCSHISKQMLSIPHNRQRVCKAFRRNKGLNRSYRNCKECCEYAQYRIHFSVGTEYFDPSKEKLPAIVTVDFIPYLIEFDFKMTTKKCFIPIYRF